jgi:hypothetical protein
VTLRVRPVISTTRLRGYDVAMTIGRNPHVAKARNAEQKAELAEDEMTRVRAHREAAHLWDRACDREKPGKIRDGYAANADRNRAIADAGARPPRRAAGVGPLGLQIEGDDDGEPQPPDPLSIN